MFINILVVTWAMSIVISLILMLFLSLVWLTAVIRWCAGIDDELFRNHIAGNNIISTFLDKAAAILLWTTGISSIALIFVIII